MVRPGHCVRFTPRVGAMGTAGIVNLMQHREEGIPGKKKVIGRRQGVDVGGRSFGLA